MQSTAAIVAEVLIVLPPLEVVKLTIIVFPPDAWRQVYGTMPCSVHSNQACTRVKQKYYCVTSCQPTEAGEQFVTQKIINY